MRMFVRVILYPLVAILALLIALLCLLILLIVELVVLAAALISTPILSIHVVLITVMYLGRFVLNTILSDMFSYGKSN